jgi:CHAD domain
MSIPSQFRRQASRIILAQFNKMMSYEKGTLLGEDIECLHHMRVASRRLRARIRDFEPLFRGRRYARIEKQIRRITRRLGAARDMDVFEAFLVALPQVSGPADGSAATAPMRVPEELLQAARARQAGPVLPATASPPRQCKNPALLPQDCPRSGRQGGAARAHAQLFPAGDPAAAESP